jgi:C-terminal processing protease CtpA/Prc
MKIYFLFSGFLLFFQVGYSQNDFQVKNLAAFCKYWGFLKYYHPATSKRNIDWDTVLTNNYFKVKAAESKEKFNQILLSVSQKLGELKQVKYSIKPSDSEAINADFKWMEDTTIISSQVCNYLRRVKKNHKPFKNRYIGTGFWGLTILKEKSYPEMIYPDESYRFLSLARYWNVINYYFPDKYLMDNNWNSSLEKAIPIFINASDKDEYYRAIEWITARTNDSHASIVSSPFIDSTFKTPPFVPYYSNDTLTIIRIANDSIANIFNIKKGDAIIKINGKSIRDLWQDVKEHYSASNESFAQYWWANSSIMTRNKHDSSELVIIREGKEITIKVKNYSMKVLWKIWKFNKPVDLRSCSILTDTVSGKKYGYLNRGTLKRKEINKFLKQMKGIDYLIINVRNYSIHNAWPKLANKLISGKKFVASYTQPNYKYPGYIKYYPPPFISPFRKTVGSNRNNNYKGKVIILVDHTTISNAEYETMTLQLAPQAIIIGTQTAGADGDISTIVFPGNYKNTFTGLGWFYADGRQTQRIGIVPDIKVDYTIQTKLNGIDPILQRALELIRTGK